ncbi:Uncharacterised protein [Chlamydia abortus]|nr:Uncharacterised protein [Chlamydia abortus]
MNIGILTVPDNRISVVDRLSIFRFSPIPAPMQQRLSGLNRDYYGLVHLLLAAFAQYGRDSVTKLFLCKQLRPIHTGFPVNSINLVLIQI